jgi:hypothetical protein
MCLGKFWTLQYTKIVPLCRRFTHSPSEEAARRVLDMIPKFCDRRMLLQICVVAASNQEAASVILKPLLPLTSDSSHRRSLMLHCGDIDPLFFAKDNDEYISFFNKHKSTVFSSTGSLPVVPLRGNVPIDHILATLILLSNKNSTLIVRSIARQLLCSGDTHVDTLSSVQSIILSKRQKLGMFAHFSLFALCRDLRLFIDDDFKSFVINTEIWEYLEVEEETPATDDASDPSTSPYDSSYQYESDARAAQILADEEFARQLASQ